MPPHHCQVREWKLRLITQHGERTPCYCWLRVKASLLTKFLLYHSAWEKKEMPHYCSHMTFTGLEVKRCYRSSLFLLSGSEIPDPSSKAHGAPLQWVGGDSLLLLNGGIVYAPGVISINPAVGMASLLLKSTGSHNPSLGLFYTNPTRRGRFTSLQPGQDLDSSLGTCWLKWCHNFFLWCLPGAVIV